MKSLLWKELRENAAWAAVLFAGITIALIAWAAMELPGRRIDESMNSDEVLGILLFAAPLGALALGFLQVLPEIQRDAWAFLLHRAVSPERIFLAKSITGMSLYLAAVIAPFLLAALWVAAGAPERRVFHPYMLWPGTAIVLASAGFHPAAMLVALRRASWFGTRLLPLALPAGSLIASLAYIFDVSEMPSPALLLLIVAAHAVTTAAARGAFVRGGEAAGQPLAARAALGASLALSAVGILGCLLGLGIGAASELRPPRTGSERRGAHRDARLGLPVSVPLHRFHDGGPGRERIALHISGHHGTVDEWIHSTPDGTLSGYREERGPERERRFRLARIAGPDGFRDPSAPPARAFGPLVSTYWRHHRTLEIGAGARRSERRHRTVLTCAEGIYDINFAREEVRLVLAAPEGERIRGVSIEQTADGAEIAVAMDHTVRFHSAREEVAGTITDEATGEHGEIRTFLPGPEVARAAIPAPVRGFARIAAGRSAGSGSYIFLGERKTHAFGIARLVEADAAGKVIERRDIFHEDADAGLALASLCAAATFTPPVAVVAAAIADESLLPRERPGWTLVFAAILTLQVLACAAVARAAARRHGLPRAKRRLWTGLGALLGPAGLVALAGTGDWPPTPPCAACGRRRAVSLSECPWCGAGLEPPPRDGTEVIEETLRREPTRIESRSIP